MGGLAFSRLSPEPNTGLSISGYSACGHILLQSQPVSKNIKIIFGQLKYIVLARQYHRLVYIYIERESHEQGTRSDHVALEKEAKVKTIKIPVFSVKSALVSQVLLVFKQNTDGNDQPRLSVTVITNRYGGERRTVRTLDLFILLK